jgi:hypothetical protein
VKVCARPPFQLYWLPPAAKWFLRRWSFTLTYGFRFCGFGIMLVLPFCLWVFPFDLVIIPYIYDFVSHFPSNFARKVQISRAKSGGGLGVGDFSPTLSPRVCSSSRYSLGSRSSAGHDLVPQGQGRVASLAVSPRCIGRRFLGRSHRGLRSSPCSSP